MSKTSKPKTGTGKEKEKEKSLSLAEKINMLDTSKGGSFGRLLQDITGDLSLLTEKESVDILPDLFNVDASGQEKRAVDDLIRKNFEFFIPFDLVSDVMKKSGKDRQKAVSKIVQNRSINLAKLIGVLETKGLPKSEAKAVAETMIADKLLEGPINQLGANISTTLKGGPKAGEEALKFIRGERKELQDVMSTLRPPESDAPPAVVGTIDASMAGPTEPVISSAGFFDLPSGAMDSVSQTAHHGVAEPSISVLPSVSGLDGPDASAVNVPGVAPSSLVAPSSFVPPGPAPGLPPRAPRSTLLLGTSPESSVFDLGFPPAGSASSGSLNAQQAQFNVKKITEGGGGPGVTLPQPHFSQPLDQTNMIDRSLSKFSEPSPGLEFMHFSSHSQAKPMDMNIQRDRTTLPKRSEFLDKALWNRAFDPDNASHEQWFNLGSSYSNPAKNTAMASGDIYRAEPRVGIGSGWFGSSWGPDLDTRFTQGTNPYEQRDLAEMPGGNADWTKNFLQTAP